MIARSRRGRVVLLLALLPISLLGLVAQASGWQGDARAARLELMRDMVRAIQVSPTSNPGGKALPLSPEPLHRWNDPTREFSDGSLWAFGSGGRPAALVTTEFYGDPKGAPFWSLELIALGPAPVVAEAQGSYLPLGPVFQPGAGGPLRWSPREGVSMQEVAGAPEPGRTEAERLRQMKAITGRISAREVGSNTDDGLKTELRLMPRPILRYTDADAGILDGAIFVYAYGTNPELLVLIEAARQGGRTVWSCGFARLTRAAPTVLIDGQEIWSRPYADEPKSEDAYYIVRTSEPSRD